MAQQMVAQRYQLEAQLGSGGVATVYRGLDTLLQRPVAVKLMRDQVGAEEQQDFLHEARTIASLSHPSIVAVYDVGVDAGRPFIVMELLPGGSLRDRVERGALALPETLRVIQRVVDALEVAHRQGVLHLDIKPENIIFDGADAPKLADFGISKRFGQGALRPDGTMLGTPAYVAPEYISGQPLDARADVYSLGIVLYEMLTGRVPFEGATPMEQAMARLMQDPPDPQQLNPAIPPGLERIVMRSLARDPAARYSTAAALGDALRQLEQVSGNATMAMELGAARPARQQPAPPRQVPPAPQPRRDPSVIQRQPAPPAYEARPVEPAYPAPGYPPAASAQAPSYAPPAQQPRRGLSLGWIVPVLLLLGIGGWLLVARPFAGDEAAESPAADTGGTEDAVGGEPAGEPLRLEDSAWTGGYRSSRPTYGGRTATWVYGHSTDFSTMATRFEVDAQPSGTATLVVEGMDSENPDKTPISVMVNGVEIYNGPNPLPDDDDPIETGTWGSYAWEFDAALLRAGENVVSISNLAPGQFSRPPFFMLDYAEIRY